jgi:hypothetical protein
MKGRSYGAERDAEHLEIAKVYLAIAETRRVSRQLRETFAKIDRARAAGQPEAAMLSEAWKILASSPVIVWPT